METYKSVDDIPFPKRTCIEPCPFCGGPGLVEEVCSGECGCGTWNVVVACQVCGAKGPEILVEFEGEPMKEPEPKDLFERVTMAKQAWNLAKR